MKAILAGGSGFLGENLTGELLARGWEVIILTRKPRLRQDAAREIAWDGKNPGLWARELAGADALVNLTGRSINCVHTPENRRLILESRVDSVRALGAALAQGRCPPPVWVQVSALALYGDAGDRRCDETAPPADDFFARVCRQWEEALAGVSAPATRKVVLRIGLVLGAGGGALGPLAKLTRLFLGGTVGSGRQYVSWLHVADLNGMFLHAIECPDLAGACNACAPNPVTNTEFMCELRRVLDRPWSPPVPAWAVRLGARFLLRTDAELALTGQRGVPARMLRQGFEFRHAELRPALREIYRR